MHNSFDSGLQIVDANEQDGLNEDSNLCSTRNWLTTAQNHANQHEEPTKDPALIDLCPFHIHGRCKYKESCKFIHGEKCLKCNANCLHPFRLEEQAAHISECCTDTTTNQHEIECGICYEPVLSSNEARFGLLNCNHPFCLSCIKTWRLQTQSLHQGSSLESIRSCPICRTVTHFVTPSTEWTVDPVKKLQIIDGYKKKLKTIDCKHFNFAKGECPFGTSCFYAHRDRAGNWVEDPSTFARTVVASDGIVQPVPHLKLAEFFESVVE